MKRLAITLCLAISLAIGSFGVGWSGDFQKGPDAYEKGDYAIAFREWKPLADQGDASAQHNLGVMYDEGYGVLQDHKAAVKWYTLAAEQGDAPAQANLGYMYETGNGVLQDYVKAHMWYNICASNGDEVGGKNRDIIAKQMTPSQIEEAQKLARECVAKNYKGC